MRSKSDMIEAFHQSLDKARQLADEGHVLGLSIVILDKTGQVSVRTDFNEDDPPMWAAMRGALAIAAASNLDAIDDPVMR